MALKNSVTFPLIYLRGVWGVWGVCGVYGVCGVCVLCCGVVCVLCGSTTHLRLHHFRSVHRACQVHQGDSLAHVRNPSVERPLCELSTTSSCRPGVHRGDNLAYSRSPPAQRRRPCASRRVTTAKCHVELPGLAAMLNVLSNTRTLHSVSAARVCPR